MRISLRGTNVHSAVFQKTGVMELDEADGELPRAPMLWDPMRQQFAEFLQREDGQLAPDAVTPFVRFCFELDTVLAGEPQVPAGILQTAAGMQFVTQGCDKVLKKIVDGLAPSVAGLGPCGKRIAKQQHAYKCLDCGSL